MPNPALNYDSDWDYHNSNLSPEDQIVQALSDGEDHALTCEYINWMIKQRPEAVANLLIDTAEAHTHLDAFARHYVK
ncbi:hypothetical protein [Vreelandella massiliensis]|uniref:hypothetical protein n=1 Tax=Vreelandella massiliensis TaxID=1816686 RepID=UPI00096ABF9D|nr:hypothetical protein [Halomonas massiliensis]